MLALLLLGRSRRHPAVVGATPRRGVVDLRGRVDGLEWPREVAGDDGDRVAGFLEAGGYAEADDAGAGEVSVKRF